MFRFSGNAQNITTSATTTASIPSKRENFINFPHIEINNDKHVLVNARLAAETQNIDLKEGWLILDSNTARTDMDVVADAAEADNRTVSAHLLVEGSIDYHESDWVNLPANERGFIDVRLAIPSEGDRAEKSIVGFGSPFKEMQSDYFIYNTLLAPSPAGFLASGALEKVVTMKAGVGYVVGIDLRGKDKNNYPEIPLHPGIDFDQRAHEGHYFNRHRFAGDPNRLANQVFGTDLSQTAYTAEQLNTQSLNFNLSKGYNYLSNPFTCPLDISELIEDAPAPAWNIIPGSTTLADIQNKVWILHPDAMAERIVGQPTRSKYSYSYLVVQNPGGTYIDDDAVNEATGTIAIAPLQMFLVRASKAESITIPKEKRVMGTTKFIRNTPAVKKSRKDDFIIEFKDQTTGTSDRLSLVLRRAKQIAQDTNLRDVTRMTGTSVDGQAAQTGNAVVQNLSSQIYTKDETGKPLTVRFLPIETTNSVVVYHTPSTVAQPISIRGFRIHTMDEVQEMYLEDKLKNTYTAITPEMVYETSSKPTDREDRFVIHFRQTSGIGDIEEVQKIYAYDSNGRIWVEGFQNSDIGNKLELIDLNGRILSSKAVNELKMNLSDSHIEGVYIIKMSGSRSQTIKLLQTTRK